MGQFKKFRSTAVSLLGAGMLVMAGCGGGGDSGPAYNPVTLTEANAVQYARAGFAQGSVITSTADTYALRSITTPSIQDSINLAIGQIFTNRLGAKSIVTGVTTGCPDGGSVSDSSTGNINAWSGTITFDNCNFSGTIIHGSFTFSSTFNDITEDYTAVGNGNLRFKFDGEDIAIAMDFDLGGNYLSGDFSQSFNFSIVGSNGGDFSLTTTQPITGNGFNVETGQFIVSGANGTRVRVTVGPTNWADVELDSGDGNFVFVTAIAI
ncbi:MAG: hypothetical protein OEY09_18095 [Gammaproteobacteria bacterium]|nr:hypothetical protein [Gammaproteobacteria bacterium]